MKTNLENLIEKTQKGELELEAILLFGNQKGLISGLIKTEQSEMYYGDKNSDDMVSKTIPLGRMGSPEDIGNGCLFLASDLASYVSGATLEIHGGGEKPIYQNVVE